jgi:hypothetical protein
MSVRRLAVLALVLGSMLASGNRPSATDPDAPDQVRGSATAPDMRAAVSAVGTVAGHSTAGTPLPRASSINFTAGQTRANNAVLHPSGLGELAVRSG